MRTEQFTNELGNHISILVDEKDIDNVPGILITISGPTSLSENHITRKEAQILLELLQTTLV